MALLVFVDDSSCRFARAGRKFEWFGYGGLAIQDTELPSLDERFEALKDTYGFPRRLPPLCRTASLDSYREAKYNPGHNQWMRANLVDQQRRQFFLDAVGIVRDLSGIFLFSYYDTVSKPCDRETAKARALENLYERIKAVALDSSASVGVVVCDIEGSRQQAQQLIGRATNIARLGTWFQPDIRRHLYPVLLTADSHSHAGLQIADVAVGTVSKMLGGEAAHAPTIWSAVMGLLYKQNNTARGWGIKVRCDAAAQVYVSLGL